MQTGGQWAYSAEMKHILSALSLAGCASTLPRSVDEAHVDHEMEETEGPSTTDSLDSADPTVRLEAVPDNTVEEAPAGLRGTGDAVFAQDRVHLLELTISADGMASLSTSPYTWVQADIRYDGIAVNGVGVRIKGRLGSARSISGKPAFKLDFLEYGGTERLDGLEKLNINNMVQDCAKVKEFAAYGIHELTGTPSPRVAYTEVRVNGATKGLYSVVEAMDDVFLKTRFADPSGNLYDGDYELHPDRSYTLVDFREGIDQLFLLDEGEDNGLSDIAAITAAAAGSGTVEEDLGHLVDIDQLARFIAATAWTGHSDSYVYYSNNYRVWFDPSRDGRAVLLPWDPDWAFYRDTVLRRPYGILAARCIADTACMDKVRLAVDELDAALETSTLRARIGEMAALIDDSIRADPYREQSLGDIAWCQGDVDAWFDRRDAELSSADY